MRNPGSAAAFITLKNAFTNCEQCIVTSVSSRDDNIAIKFTDTKNYILCCDRDPFYARAAILEQDHVCESLFGLSIKRPCLMIRLKLKG